LDYIAHCVQFPGKKIRWAILIQGAEGCGKSFLAKVIGTILGEDNVKFLSNDAIRSQWSDWTIGTQVNVIGEIRVAGHNRHDIMNRLKEAVTDDRISVTQRNRSVRTERNLTNYVMFTNYQDALALMHGSRRYFIVKSALQTEEQVLALGPEYFNELFEAIAQNAAGLRAFFEDWVISDDFPADGRAPKTIYLEEMIEDSANDLVGAIRRLIREGESPLIADDMIYSGILESALELEGLRESPQVVARMLREENFVRLAGRGIEINGMRKALWVKSGKFAGLSDAQIFEIARQRANGEEPTQPEEEWI
jgi:energy-coupling factor transporter ATP-binding protein EcfA2